MQLAFQTLLASTAAAPRDWQNVARIE